MKIVLLGYMGSGKSTIGRLLSEKMNYHFIDLDAYIEEKEGLSIQEIFSTKGEIYFRLQESNYLKEVLDLNSDIVLSLGGGTPCYANNMQTILATKEIRSIYLKATIPVLLDRLKGGKEQRPLIADLSEEKLMEYIGKHLFERAPFYEQSTTKILIGTKTKEEQVSEIIAGLH